MSNVTAKVASTFLIGVAAAAVSMALPSHPASAADSCLTEPNGDNAQGKHWYFHIERGTGRHCWYQRGTDEKSARADDDQPAVSEKPASQPSDTATSRSIADAHAEMAQRTRAPDNTNAAAAPSVWPSPPAANDAASNTAASSAASAQAAPDSPLASRWPQAGDTAQSDNPQPEASLMVADTQDTSADASSPPPPVAAAPERKIGSIQKLALVAAGALALAGLTGSAVYRLGRRRRRNDWLRERTAWQSAQNPNMPPWVAPPDAQHNPLVADLDETKPVATESNFSIAMSETEAGGDRVEKIEDFLARLTQQLHEELEGTRPHNA